MLISTTVFAVRPCSQPVADDSTVVKAGFLLRDTGLLEAFQLKDLPHYYGLPYFLRRYGSLGTFAHLSSLTLTLRVRLPGGLTVLAGFRVSFSIVSHSHFP